MTRSWQENPQAAEVAIDAKRAWDEGRGVYLIYLALGDMTGDSTAVGAAIRFPGLDEHIEAVGSHGWKLAQMSWAENKGSYCGFFIFSR
jgi:hypothetical protein